jgi:hypothetical protein
VEGIVGTTPVSVGDTPVEGIVGTTPVSVGDTPVEGIVGTTPVSVGDTPVEGIVGTTPVVVAAAVGITPDDVGSPIRNRNLLIILLFVLLFSTVVGATGASVALVLCIKKRNLSKILVPPLIKY